MTNVIFRYVNVLILMVFCVQHSNTHGFMDEGFSDKVHHLSMENESDSATKEHISVRRKLSFLGDTPGAKFINGLSVVSSIFTIWGFIETREVVKQAKKMEDFTQTNESEKIELLEEIVQKLDGLHSGFAQELASVRHSLKQLTCRFDAVHAESKGIHQDCLQFIRSYNQVSAKLSVKHSRHKTNSLDESNMLSIDNDIQ